jgi:hypothetical protein
MIGVVGFRCMGCCMTICICAAPECQIEAEVIAQAFSKRIPAEIRVSTADELEAELRRSDMLIFVSSAQRALPAAQIDLAKAQHRLVMIAVVDGAYPSQPVGDAGSPSVLRLRREQWQSDVMQFVGAASEQLMRLHDARHEYNNIAAIASLSSNPLILAQARALLLRLRSEYPEYTEDPEGLNGILGQAAALD